MIITVDEVVTKTIKREVSRHCDRCKVNLPLYEMYDINRFELRREQGWGCPEGGSYEAWEVEDLCDNCIDFLEQLLKNNGFTIKYSEVDF